MDKEPSTAPTHDCSFRSDPDQDKLIWLDDTKRRSIHTLSILHAAINQKEEDMGKEEIYIYYCNLHRKEGRGGNINAISRADTTHRQQ
jgi:hypothetical protein